MMQWSLHTFNEVTIEADTFDLENNKEKKKNGLENG